MVIYNAKCPIHGDIRLIVVEGRQQAYCGLCKEEGKDTPLPKIKDKS